MRRTDGWRCSCQSLVVDWKGRPKREKGRTLRVRPSRERQLKIICSAWASDTARPIVVDRATAQGGAESGPVECHAGALHPRGRRCQEGRMLAWPLRPADI